MIAEYWPNQLQLLKITKKTGCYVICLTIPISHSLTRAFRGFEFLLVRSGNCVWKLAMAGKNNNQRNMQMQDVEGYIHDVSTIKTPTSGNRYFDFTIQEGVDSTRVVCFTPEKRESVKGKETAKSPVQILNVSPQK